MYPSLFERLESRRLLAAAPSAGLSPHGMLMVFATAGDETIRLELSRDVSPPVLNVTVNGVVIGQFAPSDVHAISVSAGRGDDEVVIDDNVRLTPLDGDLLGAFIWGGPGDDRITGGPGDDSILGGPGRDTLVGAGGKDFLRGGPGADTLSGGDHDDILTGNAGRDTLVGAGGNDSLNGGPDADTVNGGDGDDVVTGGPARDLLTGGLGADNFALLDREQEILDRDPTDIGGRTLIPRPDVILRFSRIRRTPWGS